jgi:glutathione S-transferase
MPARAETPVLYGRHASPFVRRVAVTLRLYGIDYRHVPLMPFGPDKAELAAFNPIVRLPALQLWDAALDCKRLEALAERLQGTAEFQATWPEPETLTNQLT